ncbi:unnamed protein product [Schistosoma margrebowiei]|uniref:Uncharacterized protein n=1 Tax=Schistosoma margrebowiei TaxID=48269 RepID=A0A183MVF5_9TREM|nr:unnamed protein product [Schistosoma margrebowiei]
MPNCSFQDARTACINYEAVNELDIQSMKISNTLLSRHDELQSQGQSNLRSFNGDSYSRVNMKGWTANLKRGFPIYFSKRDELSTTPDGILCLNDHIVISPSLRKSVLEDLHSGHLGVEKMKTLARPEINAEICHYEAHNNAVFDVKWLSSGSSFLTASGDQSIRLIDAETGVIIQQFFGHTMSVRSLSFMPSDCHIFASTSRDGSIRMWDTRVKPDALNFRGSPGISSVGVLPQCHVPFLPNSSNTDGRRTRTPKRSATDAQSVTSVLFVDDNTFLSAGSSDGSIKMWDLRRVFCVGSKKQAKPKFILPYSGTSQKQSGYSDLVVNSYRTRLFANCLDNVVYEYDLTQLTTQPGKHIYMTVFCRYNFLPKICDIFLKANNHFKNFYDSRNSKTIDYFITVLFLYLVFPFAT